MITVNIRKQGGAAVITIPSDVLKILNLEIGSALELDITKEGFIAHPVSNKSRKRYTIAELLQEVTPEELKALKKSDQSFSRREIGWT